MMEKKKRIVALLSITKQHRAHIATQAGFRWVAILHNVQRDFHIGRRSDNKRFLEHPRAGYSREFHVMLCREACLEARKVSLRWNREVVALGK